MITVRVYEPERDGDVLRACVIELQDYERSYAPGMPAGVDMVRAYLALMKERCEIFRGQIFLAETEDRVVGLASVWGRVTSEEPDDDPTPYAYLADIVVLSAYRGRGVGRALMQTAERYACECGVSELRVRMLARNGGARTFYAKNGFGEVELEMAKRLV